MKITKEKLKNIIKEELEKELNEFNPYHVAAAAGYRNNRTKSSSNQSSTSSGGELSMVYKIRNKILFAVKDKESPLEDVIKRIQGYKKELEDMYIRDSEIAKKSREDFIQLADKMITAATNRSERGKKFTGKIKNWWQEFSEKPEEWKE